MIFRTPPSDPDAPRVRVTFARVLGLAVALTLAVSRLHADRSYSLMKQLLHAAPDSYWVHLANAQVQESLQRYDLAQQEYRKVIELNPNSPGAHVGLGRAILGASKDPQAINEAARELNVSWRSLRKIRLPNSNSAKSRGSTANRTRHASIC